MARQNGDDTEERVSQFLGLVDLSESERNQPATSEPLSLDHQLVNEREARQELEAELEMARRDISERDDMIDTLAHRLELANTAVRNVISVRNRFMRQRNDAREAVHDLRGKLREADDQLHKAEEDSSLLRTHMRSLYATLRQKEEKEMLLLQELEDKKYQLSLTKHQVDALNLELVKKEDEDEKHAEMANDSLAALAKAEQNRQKLARNAERLEIEGARLEQEARKLRKQSGMDASPKL